MKTKLLLTDLDDIDMVIVAKRNAILNLAEGIAAELISRPLGTIAFGEMVECIARILRGDAHVVVEAEVSLGEMAKPEGGAP